MKPTLSEKTAPGTARDVTPNRDLFIPYLAPYFAYVAVFFFLENRVSMTAIYAVRLVLVPALLVWAWRWYVPLRGPNHPLVSVGVGTVAGVVGCGVWLLLLAPFVDPDAGEVWTSAAFFLRMASAALIVPVFEELFLRGYVFRVALQWDRARKSRADNPLSEALDENDIGTIEPGAWSAWAVGVSTVAFALGHHVYEWPAAVAYGLLMAGLWMVRKDLLSCIVAHGVTNFTLALYVQATGQWQYW